MKQLTVKDAKQLAEQSECDQIIVLQIKRDDRKIALTTYGKDRDLCSHARTLGDMAFDLVVDNYLGCM